MAFVFSFGFGQQKNEEPVVTRILFLLDGSGSMDADWEGNSRMDIAKSLLSDLVDSLGTVPNVELGLRAYGHQSPRARRDCQDTKLEVPFAKGSHVKIKDKLKGIEPKGVTPLAYSLEQATHDFTNPEKTRNVIIIITDGLESCDGNPCAISLELQKRNIFLKPFIIGIDMNENFANQFDCVGRFYNAKDPKTFDKVLSKVITQTLGKTKIKVDLLDIYNEPTETNVNMTFVNRFTQEPVYDLVHHKLPNGVSESVEIDPILSYDIIVSTMPPVVKKNINIEGGENNVIEIKTPQGDLKVAIPHSNEYGTSLPLLVKRKGSDQTLNVQNVNETQKYLVGKYDIEVLTLPRTYFTDVRVDQSRTTTLDVASPGRFNVVDNLNGYGSIYEIKDGKQELIYTIDPSTQRLTLPMQPGEYKIVFKSKNASSNTFTAVKEFTIKSGATTSIKLFTL